MTTKNPLVLFPLLIGSMLLACNTSNPSVIVEKSNKIDSSPVQQGDTPDFRDSIVYDKTRYPNPEDTAFIVKILPVGGFHGDEVWDSAVTENWYGLFKGGDKYYLSQTTVAIDSYYDPIVDEDSLTQQTGKEVKVNHKDSCIMLLAGLSDLFKNQDIASINVSQRPLTPGDTASFHFNGVDYMLFATGSKREVRPDDVYIWNYKLYLTASKNGKRLTQLLVAQPSFDDAMVNIIFAGDIDEDGLLDLLIDTSYHYNVEQPTLYLSQPADADHLLIIAGQHSSVGC